MARPTTKKDLLNTADEQYKKLIHHIDSMSETNQEKEFTFDITAEKGAHWERDKNIRDVLIHLIEWHRLLIDWVESNTAGIDKSFLPEPYNWKSYGDMNVAFWNKHQNTPYHDARRMLDESHQKTVELIERFSNEELFEKGSFKWTKGSTLGQYCVSTTSSHYDWAIKKIRKHIKTW